MFDMPAVKDKKLIALLLEEALPAWCVVEGVDFSAPEDESTADTVPTFLQRYEYIAVAEIEARDAVIERDRQTIGGTPSTSTKHDVDNKLLDEKKISS